MGKLVKISKTISGREDFLSGFLLLLLLYLFSALLAPMCAPWEYHYAYRIHQTFPGVPLPCTLLRVIPMILVFLVALLVRLVSSLFHQKRPGWTAACFLLLPPVFLAGSRIWAVPVLMLGPFCCFAGILLCCRPRKPLQRWYGILCLLLGGGVLFFLPRIPFFWNTCWYFPFFPFVALLLTALFETLEEREVNLGLWLNRFARFGSYSLTLLSLLILLPVLLRLFHVEFPESLSPYQSERIYRPVVVLLVPLLWFHLLRLTPVLERKLLFLSVGIGFLLLALPMALPWHTVVDLMPEFMMEKLPEIKKGGARCFADAKTAPVLGELLHCKVQTVGLGEDDVPPALLVSEIRNALKEGDVIFGYEGHRLDEYMPAFPGIHYRAGKRVYCRFFGGKTK